jgi:hypothetical protein
VNEGINKMGSHVIVHLDQNYLSNMAKARIESIEDESQAKFWGSLFYDLKKATLADKIACPASEFQTTEAMYDKRLEEPVRQVIDELSWGLKFRQRDDILETLISGAASSFLGKNGGIKETWATVFESDPQAPTRSRMQDIGGIAGQKNVHISLPDWVVEHDRQLKNKYVKGEELFAKTGNVCRDWDDEVLAQKMSLIDSWRKQGKIGIINGSDIDTSTKFLESEELLNIPYMDISSSINTAISKCYPERKDKGSDLYDVITLATVLPYCDVVTTDSFMKETLVKILHFDDKYEVMIFSATEADRLAFQKYIRELK